MLNVLSDGNRYWFNSKGLLHREDGPAMEHTDGYKKWALYGSKMSREMHEEWMRKRHVKDQ